MRNIFIPLSFTALLFGVAGIQCRKDKPSSVLPPITQEGRNTIGFKVNDEVWVPYYKCSFGGNPCAEISARYGPPSTSPDHFSLKVARESSYLSIISQVPLTVTGNKFDSVNIKYLGKKSSGVTHEWSKMWNGTLGIFEITKIDPVGKIISGIFSFKLYSTYGGITDSIDITDGRFDFMMNACICR